MNIPSLPTDNLYKFFALSGVFVFVAACYFGINSFSKMYELSDTIETELETERVHGEKLQEILEAADRSAKALIDTAKASGIEIEDMKLTKEQISKNESIYMEVEKSLLERRLTAIESNEKMKRYV